jgi:hypothetical protein
MWVAIHKCMKAMLEISLYSYLFSLQQNWRRGWNRFFLEEAGIGGKREMWHKQCKHI